MIKNGNDLVPDSKTWSRKQERPFSVVKAPNLAWMVLANDIDLMFVHGSFYIFCVSFHEFRAEPWVLHCEGILRRQNEASIKPCKTFCENTS